MPGRRGRSASSMPKNLRRPGRINIMSTARSQPDRIGPLCPIPNQSSPPFYHRLGGCTGRRPLNARSPPPNLVGQGLEISDLGAADLVLS
jgi:hypothetical protein